MCVHFLLLQIRTAQVKHNHIIQLNWYAFLINLRRLEVPGGKFKGKGMLIVILLSKLVCQYTFHMISGNISF